MKYLENFESYKDTYDFRLQPKWGKVNIDSIYYRGDLVPKEGTNKSKALHGIGLCVSK